MSNEQIKRNMMRVRDMLMEAPHIDGSLSKLERNTIETLVGYQAYDYHVQKAVIWDLVLKNFQAANKGDLTRHNYNNVVRFLVDLTPTGAIH